MNILEKILEEASKIHPSEVHGPDQEVAKGEEIIGEMTDFQKQLFALVGKYIMEAKKVVTDNLTSQKPDIARMHRETERLRIMSGLVTNIMWRSIEDTYGAWEYALGIRKGFKAVKLREEHNTDHPSMLTQSMIMIGVPIPPELAEEMRRHMEGDKKDKEKPDKLDS